MTQYIDKDALVAKIDDWRHNIMMGVCTTHLDGRQRADSAFEYEILGIVRDFLNTLEVKEVDLEKEIDNVWNPHFNLGWDDNSLVSINHKSFESIAKHFFVLGMAVNNKAQKGE